MQGWAGERGVWAAPSSGLPSRAPVWAVSRWSELTAQDWILHERPPRVADKLVRPGSARPETLGSPRPRLQAPPLPPLQPGLRWLRGVGG